MIMGERSADGEVKIEAAIGCVEDEFGCVERVVLVQLEQAEVEATCVGSIEIVEAEIKLEDLLSDDECVS